MDPKKQECLGLYLYGAGYYSRDQNTLGLVTGQKTPPHFCMTCPKVRDCESEHERRVRRNRPQDVEEFDRHMRAAQRRGIPPTIAARVIGQMDGDPFAEVAVENFSKGHADRGIAAGPLTR